jgi:hypothetical protein
MKIRSVEAELFHAYTRTDRHDEADGRFSQIANALKNGFFFLKHINKKFRNNKQSSVMYSVDLFNAVRVNILLASIFFFHLIV